MQAHACSSAKGYPTRGPSGEGLGRKNFSASTARKKGSEPGQTKKGAEGNSLGPKRKKKPPRVTTVVAEYKFGYHKYIPCDRFLDEGDLPRHHALFGSVLRR